MMDALVELSWRLYPTSVLMGLGTLLALRGAVNEWVGLRQALGSDPDKILTFLQGFRLTIIGLALVGLGAAWAWHIPVLLVLALVIGGEELLESSVHIFAVRRGRRLEQNRPAKPQIEGGTEWTQSPQQGHLTANLG